MGKSSWSGEQFPLSALLLPPLYGTVLTGMGGLVLFLRAQYLLTLLASSLATMAGILLGSLLILSLTKEIGNWRLSMHGGLCSVHYAVFYLSCFRSTQAFSLANQCGSRQDLRCSRTAV